MKVQERQTTLLERKWLQTVRQKQSEKAAHNQPMTAQQEATTCWEASLWSDVTLKEFQLFLRKQTAQVKDLKIIIITILYNLHRALITPPLHRIQNSRGGH